MTKRRARAPWYVGSSTESGGLGPSPDVWEFDTVENCTTAGVPISTTTAYTGMTIDWGDGSLTEVTSVDDYVHTYATAGQYHIMVAYDDWENVELSYSSISGVSPIAEARTSIAKVYAIPTVANTDFQYLFFRYTALTEVVDDLFAYNPQITDFTSTLSECTSLTSLPTDLFRYNTAVTTFFGTFEFSGLTSIPSGLFDNNTAVTYFYGTFNYCTGLTSIPTDLFRYNTAVESFSQAFAGCSGLTSIPTDLFRYNTAVTGYNNTFHSCTELTNQTVYIGSTIVSSATSFMRYTGDGNTVYVPADSITYIAFSNAAEVGCTVVTY